MIRKVKTGRALPDTSDQSSLENSPPGAERPGDTGPAAQGAGRKPSRRSGNDVGELLRGAYRQTVEEAIPDDLMNLLNKLE